MALSLKSSSKEELAKCDIKELEELEGGKCSGSGSFGTVFKVKFGSVTRIAKRLHNHYVLIAPDICPEDKDGIRERFNDECLLLSKLDHPCIVQFVGVDFHGINRGDVTLVMECLQLDLDRTSLDIFSYGQLALYSAIQQFTQVFNMVRDPKMKRCPSSEVGIGRDGTSGQREATVTTPSRRT